MDRQRGSESTTPPRKCWLSNQSSSIDCRPNLAKNPLARWTEAATAMHPRYLYPRLGTLKLRSPPEGADDDRPRASPRWPGSVKSLGHDAPTVARTGFRRSEPFSPGVAAGKRLVSSPREDDGAALHSMSSAGGFICECCPKTKAKKFDTQEELRYVPSLPRNDESSLTIYQRARAREAVRVYVLPQPLQQEERGQAPREFPSPSRLFLVVCGVA